MPLKISKVYNIVMGVSQYWCFTNMRVMMIPIIQILLTCQLLKI